MSYNEVLNRLNAKRTALSTIAANVQFLSFHFDDEKEIMDMVNSVKPWFINHGFLEELPDDPDNVVSFQDFKMKRDAFKDPDDL